MTLNRPLRLATRKSKLAVAQSQWVADCLMQYHHGLKVELITFDTQGDNIQHKNLSEIGGKGLFTQELEEALLSGSVDIAVHSLKDMPAELPQGLEIVCIPEREDARDAFISSAYRSVSALPDDAVVGTSSTRRAAQIKAMKPNITIVPFRGNVQTRLRKLEEGEVAATFLAVAGLNRLALPHEVTEAIEPELMLPAVGQGALAIEAKNDNEEILNILRPLHHVNSAVCVEAERSFLLALDGSCRTPLAAYATIIGGELRLEAMIASVDGSSMFRTELRGSVKDAFALGKKAAAELKARPVML